MKTSIQKLEERLFTETDGVKFSTLINRMVKLCNDGERDRVLDNLMRYAREGQLLHWRTFIIPKIIELVDESESEYQDFFRWCLTEPELFYWGIDGLLKTAGTGAYPDLVEVAQNKQFSVAGRAKAVKQLARYSQQPFDRGLSVDPGVWRQEDLRMDELLNWQRDHYPVGVGYEIPKSHPALSEPKTKLEKAAARLDKKLCKCREKESEDPANPGNRLIIAKPETVAEIARHWELPPDYLDFITRFSPLHVRIKSKGFYGKVRLYGAAELIKMQQGYSFNPVTQSVIEDWPEGYVVIADVGADPFCLDTGDRESDIVYHARHGEGQWDFEPYADSFIDFLKEL